MDPTDASASKSSAQQQNTDNNIKNALDHFKYAKKLLK